VLKYTPAPLFGIKLRNQYCMISLFGPYCTLTISLKSECNKEEYRRKTVLGQNERRGVGVRASAAKRRTAAYKSSKLIDFTYS